MSFVVPPDAKSWLPVPESSHFTIQNLPFGKFVDPRSDEDEIGVRIGDHVVALGRLARLGFLEDWEPEYAIDLAEAAQEGVLLRVRKRLSELLQEGNQELRSNGDACDEVLLPAEGLEMLLPTFTRGFVDFYSGIHHASNVGRMFRPDMEPLLPNYRHLPVAYNGRASSLVLSGHPILRPSGQIRVPDSDRPLFLPTRELDFELEMGFFIGKGSDLGRSVDVREAESHVLGLVLVNDWSARDIQRWEYQPLGPFLSKSFATSVSPWVVTLDALEPFRIQGMDQEPEPLPHLRRSGKQHFDIQLEVALQTRQMSRPQVISRSNTRYLYWSIAQQIAHMTSNGANVEPGDLCASGTISGPEPGTYGSMLELSWKGQKPLILEETGERRCFLEDGDTITFSAFAVGKGYRVGFGELSGTVVG